MNFKMPTFFFFFFLLLPTTTTSYMWPIGSVVGRKTMVLLGPYGQQQLPTTGGFLKSLAKEKPTKVN
jgi:hypothetical protein